MLARSIAIDAREARVDAADGAALTAQEFFREALDLDAQVGAVDVIRRKSGEPRELLGDLAASRCRERVARHQRIRVFADG